MTRVAVCQIRIDIDDPVGTRRALVDAAAEAAAQGASMIILPELAMSGYMFGDVAEANARAEPVDGDSVTLYRELSVRHDAVVVAGFAERSEGERPYNSLVVVDRGEVLAVYRKTHLWGTEKLVFAVGSERAPVVRTRVGMVAAMICYDLEFPEMVRDVSLRGAQLVVAPSNWPAIRPTPGERPPEVIKAQANAAVNRVFVAVADRVGAERGVNWIGGSVICDPDGYPVAGPALGAEVVIVADLDLDRALDKSAGPHNDVLTDRRTDLY
ncbi:MAG: putative amidohydrolase [Propionibacteriaceae bacterium]|nr:putative amidohydrolase [Propionibacteriaceae bacterium]